MAESTSITAYILVPVYNEAQNLPLLYNNLEDKCSEVDRYYVFVDDGSSDNSVEVIRKFLGSEDKGTVVVQGTNQGPGAAFNAGFNFILDHSQNEKDIVISIEADNTSDPNLIPEMVALNQMGYDLVLASVYAQGGGFDQTTFGRRVISSMANLIMRFVLDLRVQTLSSFYRAYSVRIIREVKQRYPQVITERGFICMVEMLLKCVRLKARVVEIPMVLHSKNRQGKSKMKIMRTTREYIRFMFSYRRTLRR